jgi:hypothetical protein
LIARSKLDSGDSLLRTLHKPEHLQLGHGEALKVPKKLYKTVKILDVV